MKPTPIEQDDPELGKLLMDVCQHNSKAAKKDRIVVDFESERVYYRTVKKNLTVGRNDPCLCGSFKKYKKCCGK
jgi:uncharacterized protein YchJ